MSKEKIRKVFLDDLPRKGSRIDWKNSIGYKVPFVYEDIDGEIEIIDYYFDVQKLTILYENKIEGCIKTGDFQKGKIGGILGKITKDFKIEIGTPFKDENRDIIITDREYRYKERQCKKSRVIKESEKYYKYHCKKCGHEGWIKEGNLKRGNGCASCSGRTVTPMNNIWNNARWMCKWISEEDAKRYTKSSGNRVEVICPDCGKKKNVMIYNIYNRKSIQCACSDKIPYPEKFMMSVLDQLGLEFEKEYSPKWAKPKRYDFYIPEYNIIIETHGEQHYKEKSKMSKFKSLKDEQENDRIKKELALSNEIEHYIVIDCRHSDFKWIKNNILNSKLNELFHLSKINWLKCEEFALSNLVKEICNYWNTKEEWETTQTIADNNLWGIKDRGTIRTYLKKGAVLDWCDYDSKEVMKRSAYLISGHNKRAVKIIKDNITIGVFESVSELERQSEKMFEVKLVQSGISQVCRSELNHYKGFTFKYISKEEYEEYLKSQEIKEVI